MIQHPTSPPVLTDVLSTDGDLLAVGLVDGAVDLLQVVGVGDELVIGDEVLGERQLGLI